jgi:hypothetical protein
VIQTMVVDLNAVARAYLASPEYAFLRSRHPAVTTALECTPALPAIIGAPLHISKALMNLVQNAAQASPEGPGLLMALLPELAERAVRRPTVPRRRPTPTGCRWPRRWRGCGRGSGRDAC